MDWLQQDSSCLGLLKHLHLDVGWGCSHAKAQLYVPDGLFTGLVADAGCELHWSYRQAPTYNFTAWRGLLTAWWSANSLTSYLTAGFLETGALPPVPFVRAAAEPAQSHGNGEALPLDGGMAGGHKWRDCSSRLRERQLQPLTCSNVSVRGDGEVRTALCEKHCGKSTWLPEPGLGLWFKFLF